MANYVFETSEYPSVRGVIGLGANEVTMPDTIIGLSVYKGETERWIMRNLTEAQWSDDANAADIRYAATHYLAALLVPTLRLVQSERIAGGNLTYAQVDLEAIATGLMNKASSKLSEILDRVGDQTPSNASMFPFFTTAKRRIDF